MLKVIVNVCKMEFVTLTSQLSAAMQLTSYSSDGSGCASVNHTHTHTHTHRHNNSSSLSISINKQ